MKQQYFTRLLSYTLLILGLSQSANANVFINEFHYDNTGSDTGEFIELAGTAGTNLNGWSIVLYNGVNGQAYDTQNLSGVLTDQCMGTGVSVINYPGGIQNGNADGIALFDDQGTLIEFISYEGALTATNGPANGQTSTDIGVSEPSNTPVGQSLQRTTITNWAGPSAHSSGLCNSPQRLADVPPTNIPVFGPFGLLAMLLGLFWFGRRRNS